MTLHAWLEHNDRRKSLPPSDFVELDSMLVLEGEAAGDSIRRAFDRSERERLEEAAKADWTGD